MTLDKCFFFVCLFLGSDAVEDSAESVAMLYSSGDSTSDVEEMDCSDRGTVGTVGKRKQSRITGRGRGRAFRSVSTCNRPVSVVGRRRGRGRGRGRGRERGKGLVQSSVGRGVGGSGPRSVCVGQLDPIPDSWDHEESSSLSYVYNKEHGPTHSLPSDISATDLFCQFFTDEVWCLLVDETNRYASQNIFPGSRAWHDTTVVEMKAFVGILILMGIQKLPRLEMYWSHKYSLISTPNISKIMSSVRFQQLFRFLHLYNSTTSVLPGQPGYIRLCKVRPFLNLITVQCEERYVVHQECTIDEAMIKFKGRVSFKQYMKDKPTKWGIKVFVLADATNGYIRRFQIYTGKGVDSNSSQIGLCTKIVLDLMEGLEDSGLHLYTDNYYTSPLLYNHLYNCGINACGTARINRKFFPKELVIQPTIGNRGSYKFLSDGPLLACAWVDKRAIYFLSTIHVAEPPSGKPCVVKRTQADGSKKDLVCPPCLPDYQKYMRGVDRIDQLCSYYNVGRRSLKWWKRVFSYGIECCLGNSYVLDGYVHPDEHAKKGRNKRDFLLFRYEVASGLIGTFQGRQRIGRPRSSDHANSDRLLPLGHWPKYVEKKGNCVVCQQIMKRKKLPSKKNRHESRIQCEQYLVYLCVAKGRDCYKKYHTQSNYCC